MGHRGLTRRSHPVDGQEAKDVEIGCDCPARGKCQPRRAPDGTAAEEKGRVTPRIQPRTGRQSIARGG